MLIRALMRRACDIATPLPGTAFPVRRFIPKLGKGRGTGKRNSQHERTSSVLLALAAAIGSESFCEVRILSRMEFSDDSIDTSSAV